MTREPLDDPATTRRRRDMVLRKPFLKSIYREWYEHIRRAIPEGPGSVLEIGSGPGFFADYCEQAITSDILWVDDLSVVLDACVMPLKTGALKAIVMTDVLHHIPRVRDFFVEARRVVKPGGAIAMIEPWNTPWSRWVYQNLHHEPFVPEANAWEFSNGGPLSMANGALPWILFERDRAKFQSEFPEWRILSIDLIMPIRYVLSGGFSGITLQPGFTFPLWRRIEQSLGKWARWSAMFAFIVLQRA